MEKNVTIIDHEGNVIGSTYPKRARGLVKKGRAEPVDDFTIMMPDAHVPTVDNMDNTEEIKMSKVIGFEARGFKIDPTCKSNNVATRMFVTDALGNNVEVYEIGDHHYNWTQISYEMPVGKDEDYEFMFAMTGDIDSGRLNDQAKCSFMIVPIHDKVKALTVDADGVITDAAQGVAAGDGKNAGAQESDEDWENRYQYSLIRREYRPTMEKLWNGESLRFYKIPFNTGDADRIRFVFLAFTQAYKVFPVKNFEEYAKLPDFDPEAGRAGRKGFGPGNGWYGGPGKDSSSESGKDAGKGAKGWNWSWNRGQQGFNGGHNGPTGWYSGPKDFKDVENVLNNIGNIVNNAVREAMSNLDKFQKGGFGGPAYGKNGGPGPFGSGPEAFKRHSPEGKRIIPPQMLDYMLKKLDEDDEVLDLANCDIISDPNFMPGRGEDGDSVDDITFSLDNATMDGDAFYRIMSKVGDCCKVNANNAVLGATVSEMELAGGSKVDDTEFHFVNAQISEAAFISIMSKVGDCCKVDLTNADIKDFDEMQDLSGFIQAGFDDTEIRVDNASMSQRFYQALIHACGDGSKVTGMAVIR